MHWKHEILLRPNKNSFVTNKYVILTSIYPHAIDNFFHSARSSISSSIVYGGRSQGTEVGFRRACKVRKITLIYEQDVSKVEVIDFEVTRRILFYCWPLVI